MTGNISHGTPGIGQIIWSNPAVYGMRRMFYLCTPSESSFEKIEDVPEYVNQAVPYFTLLIALEAVFNLAAGKRSSLPRANDAFSSLCAGIISLLPLLFLRNIEMSAFIWLHDKCIIEPLAWDSPWTWVVCMLGVDLGYYWVHRCAHEINFMWAAHQVHHSSEDYNLTTALRQSVLQRYSSWMFYLPIAFFIPPSVFVVHIQFNLIYQFWIHTECVSRLGPLEWVLNTPSHHRVHHGRNRYCIDKNYAGVLIIWDRMFGTFEPERDEDKVVYGLVHPLSSWDPIYTQLSHWKHILKSAWSMEGFGNKAKVFLHGPGWEPGKPRTGILEDIPDIHAPQQRYNKAPSWWVNIYAWLHFLLALASHQLLVTVKSDYDFLTVFAAVWYIVWTLTNIGYIFEQRWYAPFLEMARCSVFLLIDSYVCAGSICPATLLVPRTIFMASMVMCLLLLKDSVSIKKKAA